MADIDAKKKPGAGIVLIRYFGGMPLVLGLMDGDFFDLPKGRMDPGENILQTALRETEEESGISLVDFKWGFKMITLDKLTMFLAATEDDPIIRPNPETGEFEHQFAKWLQFDPALFKPHLRAAILWADSIVQGR